MFFLLPEEDIWARLRGALCGRMPMSLIDLCL